MKIVYFKIKGHQFSKSGPAIDDDTVKSVTERLSRVFQVPENFITILELS